MATNKDYVLRVDLNNLQGVIQQEQQSQQQDDTIKNLKRFVVGKVIQPFIQQTRDIISTQVGLMTGQQTEQQRANFALSYISNLQNVSANLAGSVAFARSIGATAGTGIALGLIVMGLQKTLELGGAEMKINNLRKLENEQIAQTTQRAGWSFNKTRQGA